MKRLVYALLLLVAGSTLAAPFPMTNTRYGEAPAWDAKLTTNGRDAFVLWGQSGGTWLTRIVEGEYRVGRPVLQGGNADIVWTGRFFLVVAQQAGGKIAGQLVDAQGEPVAGAFNLVESGGTSPRVAWNGRHVLLAYGQGGSVVATLLTSMGAPVNGARVPVATASSHAVASNGNGFAVVSASRNRVQVTTLQPHGAVASQSTVSTFELQNDGSRPLAIASNGSGYLAAWSTQALFDAVPVKADGTLEAPFSIARLDPGTTVSDAAVTWTGTEYAAAFIGQSGNRGRVFVARASTHSLQSLSDGPAASSLGGISLLRSGGRTLMTYRVGNAALLLADASHPEDAVPVTFGAAHQAVGAAVSSGTATFVAWNEFLGGENSMHAGVRGTDGTWAERRITRDIDLPIRAATDGSRFLMIAIMRTDMAAFLIDAQARVLARIPLPLSSDGSDVNVASNGRDFAVVYTTTKGQPALVRVNRDGVASPPLILSNTRDAYDIAVASHGSGFLVTWLDTQFHFFPPFGETDRIFAVRLRSDFTAIDVPPLLLSEHDEIVHLTGSVARDGGYEVFWVKDQQWPTPKEGLVRLRVPASGPVASQPVDVPDTKDLTPESVSLRVGPAGTTWTAVWTRWSGNPPPTRYFDGPFAPRTIPTPFSDRFLLSTPDGRLAWVGEETQDAAPYHGVSRLMFYVPDSEAAVPDAPRATLAYDGREIRIDWDAPAQPVLGYRVEYRIGDGSWNEFPRQFGAEERSARWTSITSGKSYAFRVRAFGENGQGDYSEVVRVSPGASKRRAVR